MFNCNKRRWTVLLCLAVTQLPVVSQAQTITGLNQPVDVLIPETLIPTVVARDKLDLAAAQGYLHARDRFFQMDFNRRVISGTLAEMLGTPALSSDIQLRTIGLRRGAWATYQQSSADMRGLFQAYANGVNQWLRDNPLPPEYAGLELSSVPPWTPVDSIAVGKALAFQLSENLEEIDATVTIGTYQGVGAVVGFDGTALYTEDTHRVAPPDDRVSIPGFLGSIGGVGQQSTLKSGQLNSHQAIPAPQAMQVMTDDQLSLARDLLESYEGNPYLSGMLAENSSEVGSNWWVISGDLTETGVPVLANDPHLSLGIASIFYPVHLVVSNEGTTTHNVAGVAVPGVPGVVQGCTSNMCWGSTVNPIDEMDFFFEEIKVNSLGFPTHTIYQGQEEPIIPIFQSYFANQVGDGVMDNVDRQDVSLTGGGVTFVVPRRNNGPILDLDGNSAISVQYTGFGATFEIESFLNINEAQDVFEFQEASTQFDFGSQNFAVADTAGNIAYFTPAELPIRDDLQNLNVADGGVPPSFIRDGTGALRHQWLPAQNLQVNQASPSEIMPSSETPSVINPASGFIVNANNDPIGNTLDNNPLNQLRPDGGLYYLNSSVYASFRMGRIDRLVNAAADGGTISVAEISDWQSNNQMLDAELLVPHILNAFARADAPGAWPFMMDVADVGLMPDVAELLAGWDFSTPTGIVEGYDPGDPPLSAPTPPTQDEINHSVAATVYSVWRGQMIQSTIDSTLSSVGLGDNLPPSTVALNALAWHLSAFENQQGFGASGLDFFNYPEAPSREDARDITILIAVNEALLTLLSEEFEPAFGRSENLMDYRWGKLHRIVFDHPLGDPLSLPNGLYGFSTVEGLRGIPRSGGYQVLDASSHSARADGLNEFMFGSGPARRFFGQMFPEGIAAEQIVPGGQSGVIGGPEYANQLYFWLVNARLPLLLDADVVNQIAVEQLTLSPTP